MIHLIPLQDRTPPQRTHWSPRPLAYYVRATTTVAATLRNLLFSCQVRGSIEREPTIEES